MGKPTVLLGMINDAAMSRTVAACLEYHGFEVVNFALDSLDFRYPNLRSRLAVLLKKTLGNRQAKKELMIELKRRQVQTAWNAHPQFDYALFIRSDIYPDSFLREVRRRSSVLVDFVISTHSGLSLRTFEALGYRKKLITTNAEIEKYDFYHPDNIFIWRGGSLDGLQAFIARPYHELPQEIYQKYSFGNWVRYVLDIEPHIKISLPAA